MLVTCLSSRGPKFSLCVLHDGIEEEEQLEAETGLHSSDN